MVWYLCVRSTNFLFILISSQRAGYTLERTLGFLYLRCASCGDFTVFQTYILSLLLVLWYAWSRCRGDLTDAIVTETTRCFDWHHHMRTLSNHIYCNSWVNFCPFARDHYTHLRSEFFIQGHRFDIFEDVGCYPALVNSIPTYFLFNIWPIIFGLISASYCGKIHRYFISQ